MLHLSFVLLPARTEDNIRRVTKGHMHPNESWLIVTRMKSNCFYQRNWSAIVSMALCRKKAGP